MKKEMEGVIKYSCDWEKRPIDILTDDKLQELNYWRKELLNRGVLGVDDKGLGFGNISIRVKELDQFIVSGSQTGHLAQLQPADLSLVTSFSITDNYVTCTGLHQASSEALTHAVFYQDCSFCEGVIHIHSCSFWEKKRSLYPVTDKNARYGTAELALSISKILHNIPVAVPGIIILGGHPDGVVIYGNSLAEAGREITRLLDEM